jgi:peptidoglycan/LPS O-acetylase OafA/YrhL
VSADVRPAATRGRKKIVVPAMDGFRGLAVLWIMLGHSWWELGGRVRFDHGVFRNTFVSSYMGVDLLFLISGFVLFLPAALNGGTLGDGRDYALRRAARIVPAFWVATLFAYIVARSIGEVRGGAGAWISHFLFLHQEAHQIEDIGFGVDGAMWTMSVEVFFYALLPFVALRFYKRPFWSLGIALAISELWQLLAVHLDDVLSWLGIEWAGASDAQFRMSYSFPSYLGHFAIGMAAAWIFVAAHESKLTDRLHRVASILVLPVGLAVLGVAYHAGVQGARRTGGPYDHWVNTMHRALLFGLLVLVTAFALPRAQRFVTNPVSRLFGIVSYGMYLSHLPLIKLLIPTLGLERGTQSNWSLLLLAVVVVPLALLIGVASYVLFEEPFRRWARQRAAVMRARDAVRTPPSAPAAAELAVAARSAARSQPT